MVDFSEVTEVDTVAGLLKLWLRELPDPLFSFAIHDDLIDAYSTCLFFTYPPPNGLIFPPPLEEPVATERLKRLKAVVMTLPVANIKSLALLMGFLHKYTSFMNGPNME